MVNANGPVIDRVVIDVLVNFELADSPIQKSLRELSERLTNKKDSEKNHQGFLEAELRKKEKQIENLIAALGNGVEQDTFAERVRAQVNGLGRDCERLTPEIAKAAFNTTAYDDYESQTTAVKDTLKKLKDTVLTATAVEKRELLKATIESIVWDGEQAHIFLLGEQGRPTGWGR
jgi:site-specific DNA recombinase